MTIWHCNWSMIESFHSTFRVRAVTSMCLRHAQYHIIHRQFLILVRIIVIIIVHMRCFNHVYVIIVMLDRWSCSGCWTHLRWWVSYATLVAATIICHSRWWCRVNNTNICHYYVCTVTIHSLTIRQVLYDCASANITSSFWDTTVSNS